MSPVCWLLLGLLGLVAIAIVVRLRSGYGPPQLTDALMNHREQAIVAAFANAFFPPGGPIPMSGTEAGVTRYFDDYLKRSAPLQRLLIRLLLRYLELEPFVFGPRASRFSKLPHTEQLASLESTGTSSIYFRRVSFISLRALMTMAYLANEEVARAIRMTQSADPFSLGERVFEQFPTNRSKEHP